MKNEASTKCLPGQTRLPNPNAEVNTGSSRKLPSALMNRSGLKVSGSGYMAGSCKIALQVIEAELKGKQESSYHEFPITIAPRSMDGHQ